MIKKTLLYFLLLFPLLLTAQDENIRYYDHVYKDNIKSVKFHVDGGYLTYPIVDLGNDAPLLLSFDDMDADLKSYVYTFVHCDANWEPSNISEMDYLDGFSEGDISDYEYSFSTFIDYTHYWLLLPNDDLSWKISGNYLLKVYEDEDEKELVITKRFVVVEPVLHITAKLNRAVNVSKMQTHQEIDFSVHNEDVVDNPIMDISATVLQNGRWDNAISGLKPLFTRQAEMIFDYQDKIVFPGGKEFRSVDLRDFKYKTAKINKILSFSDGEGYDVILHTERKRTNASYQTFTDVNGKYLIEASEKNNPDTEADYGYIFFSLYSPTPFYDKEVYVFGELSNWEFREEYKMHYIEEKQSYVAKIQLKEGFYDYYYVTRDGKKSFPSHKDTEGDSYETENDYIILVYYHPFGARYDRVIAWATMD